VAPSITSQLLPEPECYWNILTSNQSAISGPHTWHAFVKFLNDFVCWGFTREMQQIWDSDPFLRSGAGGVNGRRKVPDYRAAFAACHADEDYARQQYLQQRYHRELPLSEPPTLKRRDSLMCVPAKWRMSLFLVQSLFASPTLPFASICCRQLLSHVSYYPSVGSMLFGDLTCFRS
jgi:hypothetical protein